MLVDQHYMLFNRREVLFLSSAKEPKETEAEIDLKMVCEALELKPSLGYGLNLALVEEFIKNLDSIEVFIKNEL